MQPPERVVGKFIRSSVVVAKPMKTGWSLRSDTADECDAISQDWSDETDSQRPNFREQIWSLIEDDKDRDLVHLVRSQLDTVVEDFGKNPSELSCFILIRSVQFDAVNCAEAFLKGETGLPLDLTEFGYYPLHDAAFALSLKLTKLFIEFGMRTNVKTASSEMQSGGLQPLHNALDSIRRRVLWTPEESVFKLIIELTGEGLSKPIEIMRLLTNDVSKSEVSEVIYNYAAKGKIIELATLLLVLSERKIMVYDLYVPCDNVSRQDQATLRQYVVNRIVILEREVAKLVATGSTKLAKCIQMRESMTSMVLLLEVFLRIRNGIVDWIKTQERSYSGMRTGIAMLFEMADLELTGNDASYLDYHFLVTPEELGVLRPRKMKEGLGDSHPNIKHYFPSAMPPLRSLDTMEDLGCTETDLDDQKLLCKSIAIEKLRCHWTPKESIFKLIIMLCLPIMKKILESARLFAEKTGNVNEIACTYAKEGKMIELAIILMVAREKVMDPMMFQIKGEKSKRSMTFQQFINSELAQAIDLEYRLLGRKTKIENDLSRFDKQRKRAIISALPLLEIFDKVGADLQAYLVSGKTNVGKEQVIKDVVELLAEAGFKLKPKDIEMNNVPDSSIEVGTEQPDEAVQELEKDGERSTKSGSVGQDITRLSFVLPCGFLESKAAFARANKMRKFLYGQYPRECSVSQSATQSFRALWMSNISFSTHCPKAVEVQQRGMKGLDRFIPKFPMNRQFSTVALALKRGLKYA